jgi:hypothetical protein
MTESFGDFKVLEVQIRGINGIHFMPIFVGVILTMQPTFLF